MTLMTVVGADWRGRCGTTGLCHGTASRTAWARGAPWHQSPNLPRLVLTPFYC